MKKISEMTLEELRDHALELEGQKTTLTTDLNNANTRINELTELNTKLQKRNNDLFVKIEQQTIPDPEKPTPEPEKVQTCEEFARTLKI